MCLLDIICDLCNVSKCRRHAENAKSYELIKKFISNQRRIEINGHWPIGLVYEIIRNLLNKELAFSCFKNVKFIYLVHIDNKIIKKNNSSFRTKTKTSL